MFPHDQVAPVQPPASEHRMLAPEEKLPYKRLLLITGMHRSGTSFITSLCNTFGLHLPADLVPPNRWNPKGYFESTEVLNVQERLLAALGRDWFDLRAFPEDWLEQAPARDCVTALRKFLESELRNTSTLVVKDPRSSLLIPIWKTLAKDYQIDLRCLIVVRRPSQVARSLYMRDHMNPSIAMALWWRHTLSSLQGAMDRPNAIVIYEDILRRPQILFDLLKDQLEIIDQPWTDELEQRASACIDEDLDHVTHYAQPEANLTFYENCDHLYQRLAKLSSVPLDLEISSPPELDAIIAWFPEWRQLFLKHLATMKELQHHESLGEDNNSIFQRNQQRHPESQ